MAVTGKDLRTAEEPPAGGLGRRLHTAAYGITLLLVIAAATVLVSIVTERGTVLLDDLRYGRPRTAHLSAFVGHEGGGNQPTLLTAINLNRQIVVIELPGSDPSKVRTLVGPYLFGADEHLTPATLAVRDLDGDGAADLLLGIRRENIVYLNKDGAFRLPTPEEQAALTGRQTP